jgi:hypothetical protein
MGVFIHFNGQSNLELPSAHFGKQGRKSLSQTSWASEQIDNRDRLWHFIKNDANGTVVGELNELQDRYGVAG